MGEGINNFLFMPAQLTGKIANSLTVFVITASLIKLN